MKSVSSTAKLRRLLRDHDAATVLERFGTDLNPAERTLLEELRFLERNLAMLDHANPPPPDFQLPPDFAPEPPRSRPKTASWQDRLRQWADKLKKRLFPWRSDAHLPGTPLAFPSGAAALTRFHAVALFLLAVSLGSIAYFMLQDGYIARERGGPAEKGADNVFAAVSNGEKERVQAFLSLGLSANEVDEAGRPLLHLAVASRHDDILELLILRAEVNATDRDGNTALHIAALKANETAVNLLISGGVEKDRKNNAGQTAADIAQENGYDNLARLLRPGEPPNPQE